MQNDRVEDVGVAHGAVIARLIASLSPDNAAATAAELITYASASAAYGRFVVRHLVEAAFAPGAAPAVTEAAAKVVSAALERPNYLTLLAPALDGVRRVPPSAELPAALARALPGLSPVQQVQLATAVSLGAASEATKAVATAYITGSAALAALDGQALRQEEETLRGTALLARHAGAALAPLEAHLRPLAATTPFAPSQRYAGAAHVSVAGVLRELGINCVTTAAEARELLSIFPHRMTERDAAEVLGYFASGPSVTKTDGRTYEVLMLASGKSAPKTPTSTSLVVNPTPLLDAMQDGGSFNWDRIIQLLDQPNAAPFRIKSMNAIVDTYANYKAGKELLPATLFLGRWTNVGRQRVALEYMLKNPVRVNRKALAAEAPASLAPDPRPSNLTAAEVEFWRCMPFVEAAVHVASRDREFDQNVFLPAAEKLPLVFIYTLLFGTYTSTVKHLVTLRHLLQSHCPSLDKVAELVVPEAERRGKLEVLINLLSEVADAAPARTIDIMEMVLKCRSAVQPFLRGSRCSRLVVAIAMCMDGVPDADGEASKQWLQAALDGKPRSRVLSAENRFLVAMSIVEVAEILLERQLYVPSAIAALNVLLASPMRDLLKGVADCAKALLASTTSLYPEDVTNDANHFFKRLYENTNSLEELLQVFASIKERAADADTASAAASTAAGPNSPAAPAPRAKQLYACIVQLILDAPNAMYEHNTDARQRFATFFGEVLARDLLAESKFKNAWSLLLSAVVKPPNPTVADFGITALTCVKRRLADWPQYCRALRPVRDLEFRIPGIMAAIARGIRQAEAASAEEQAAANPPATAAAPAFVDPAIVSATRETASANPTSVRDKLHTLDIGTLLTSNSSVNAPPKAIQEEINFLIGNTDVTNLKNNIAALGELLRPEYYEYFSDYLVVKRASLEPNNQPLYMELVSSLRLPDLDRCMRRATTRAVQRLLASDKISTENSERTLLRNLGSWLGCITLEKNVPILQRDLDFRALVVQGLREHKLVPVVSLMARVLSSCARSTFFMLPNPWTMAQLSLLVELYGLPHLRVTLRFEVELLCSALDTSLRQIAEYAIVHRSVALNQQRLHDVMQTCDLRNSPDFKFDGDEQDAVDPYITEAFAVGRHGGPSASAAGSSRPQSRPLQPTAEPFRPKDLAGAGAGLTPQQQAAAVAAQMRASPQQAQALLQQAAAAAAAAQGQPLTAAAAPPRPEVDMQAFVAQYNLPRVPPVVITADTIKVPREVEAALRPGGGGAELRAAVAAAYARVVEKLQMDLRRLCAIALGTTQSLVKVSLAGAEQADYERCYVLAGDAMCRSTASNLCFVAFNKKPELDKALAAELEQRGVALPAAGAGADGARSSLAALLEANRDLLMRCLEYHASELAARGWLADAAANMPPYHQTLPRLSHPGVFAFGPVQQRLYRNFLTTVPCVGPLSAQLREAEDAVMRYVKELEQPKSPEPPAKPERLPQVLSLLTPVNAFYFVQILVDRCFAACHDIMPPARDPAADPATAPPAPSPVAVKRLTLLYTEYYLPLLERCVELGGDAVRGELTRHYFSREDVRFAYPKFAQDLFRRRLVDVPQFDETFSRHIADGTATIQFADALITAIVMTYQIVSSRDIPRIYAAARGVSEAPNQRATMLTPPLSQAVGPEVEQLVIPARPPSRSDVTKEQVAAMLHEWIELCTYLAEHKVPSKDRDSRHTHYLKKLQESKLVHNERITEYFHLNVILCVEHFATATLALERGREPPVTHHQYANTCRWAPPPPVLAHSDVPLQRCDHLHDLITLMFRCSPTEREKSYPLLWRILLSITDVVRAHHEALNTPPPPAAAAALPRGTAFIPVFQQQPYVRLLNNLLMLTYRQNPSSPKITKDFHWVLTELQPLHCPAFAFGWLELVAHRMFVTRCLFDRVPIPSSSGHEEDSWALYCNLLVAGIRYLRRLTANRSISSTALVFFKAFMKLLTMIAHDYQLFIAVHRQPLLNEIPLDWTQMINLLLSVTIPKGEAAKAAAAASAGTAGAAAATAARALEPEAMPEVVVAMQKRCIANAFHAAPADFAALSDALIRSIETNEHLAADKVEAIYAHLAAAPSDALLNSVVLLVAMKHIDCGRPHDASFAKGSTMHFFRSLCYLADARMRYHILCSLASQITYANCQTTFFSNVFQSLFYESPACEAQTCTEEQIIRVLGEKTLLLAPHVWGLHNLFISLLMHDSFTQRAFVHVPGIDDTLRRLRDRIFEHNNKRTLESQKANAHKAQ